MQPNFNAYGLDWMLRDYRVTKLAYHTGTLMGFVFPGDHPARSETRDRSAHQPGGVRGTHGHHVDLLDHYPGAPPNDWATAFRDLARLEAAEEEAEVKNAAGNRNADSRPSLPLEAYAAGIVTRGTET
jgi:hypothetical protein